MSFEARPRPLTDLPDDRLGTVAVSLSVSELNWTPDVVPVVMDRISRDAVAYPEQFDRRSLAPPPAVASPAGGRSAKRTIGRLAVFAVILAVVVAIVVFAATASGTEAAAAGNVLVLV